MLIGICGKSGSGKSTLANEIIQKYNDKAIHCDIDKIGHLVLNFPKVKDELINYFGTDIITNYKVDRKKLSKLVFSSQLHMSKLTEITLKYMQSEIDNLIDLNKDKIIILDWQLLPNTKYLNKCDLKILLDIPYEVRKERVIKRDNITEEAFELRDNASITYNKNNFDCIITQNNQDEIKRLVKLL